MCLGRIGQSAGLIASTIAGCGTLMRMMAVYGVGRFDLLDRAHHGRERVVGLDRHDREGDVGRGDRLAVVEDRVLAQVERQRLAVLGELPASRPGRAAGSTCRRSAAGSRRSASTASAVAMPDCTAPFRWRGACVLPITSVPPRFGSSAPSGHRQQRARGQQASPRRPRAWRRVIPGSTLKDSRE